jgi:dUTPase
MPTLKFTPCRSEYKGPGYASEFDTGADVYSSFADLTEEELLKDNPELEKNDIYSLVNGSITYIYLQPGCSVKVPTGIKLILPQKTYYENALDPYLEEEETLSFRWGVQVRPKSGRAYKESLTITNSPGTIDNSYKGELQVLLTNLSKDSVCQIKHLEKIAQIVPEKVYLLGDWWEVSNEELSTVKGTRQEGGLGSTGLN